MNPCQRILQSFLSENILPLTFLYQGFTLGGGISPITRDSSLSPLLHNYACPPWKIFLSEALLGSTYQ